MGILDRIFRRGRTDDHESEGHDASTPALSAEQERMNRALMEAQMEESRHKLEEGPRDA